MKKLLWGGVLLCLLSLLVYSLSGPKTLIVLDRYSTIQKAIDAADSGDTIEIKPGLYQESLRFKDNLTLTGTDPAKVVLMFDTRKTPVVSAFNCRGTLSNLTFKSLGINPSPEMEKNQPLLKLVHSTLKVDHCILEDSCGNGMNGLGFGSGATGTVKANECRDNTGSGLYFENEKLVQAHQNICQNNGEINYGYLRYLLLQENFRGNNIMHRSSILQVPIENKKYSETSSFLIILCLSRFHSCCRYDSLPDPMPRRQIPAS